MQATSKLIVLCAERFVMSPTLISHDESSGRPTLGTTIYYSGKAIGRKQFRGGGSVVTGPVFCAHGRL